MLRHIVVIQLMFDEQMNAFTKAPESCVVTSEPIGQKESAASTHFNQLMENAATWENLKLP